jgi:hypothetical protein
MGHLPRIAAAGFLAVSFFFAAGAAQAQLFRGPTDLSSAELLLIDAAGAAHLENARQLLAQKEWSEAVEAIRRVLENDGGRLIRVGRDAPGAAGPTLAWHVSVREYCHWRLAALATEAPEALAIYRRLVDPLAERWLQDARSQHQPALLRRVIDEAWASSSGDDAALALGDDAFSRGELAEARYWWERTGLGFLPKPPASELNPYYPDSDLNPADVQARLVLASIVAGESARATAELARFREQHPQAEGTIAGRRGNYVEQLSKMLEQAQSWPPPPRPAEQVTWGGTPARNGIFVPPPDPAGQPLWSAPLPKLVSDRDVIGEGRLRVADEMKALTAYHPVVWKNDLLVRADSRGESYLAAFDQSTGKIRWRIGYPREVYRENAPPADDGSLGETNDAHANLSRHVGVARYTLTVDGDKAFLRMGSPVTIPRSRRIDRMQAKDQGWLLGVDLAAEGKPLPGFPIRPESSDWSFEGPPLVHEGALYVAMRHVEGSRSQIYVACFELATTFASLNDDDDDARPTGRLRFRTRIASAATLSGGNLDEITNVLLTIANGTVYCNTNAGAVGAVDAASGRLKWVVTYPRALFRSNDGAGDGIFFRDLNPPLAAGELVYVMPQDSDRLFAVDALSGQVRWQSTPGLATDATTLLGVRSGVLVAAGDRLYWFNAARGTLLTQYPSGQPDIASAATASPRGIGQGTLVEGQIWWPTRENILIFRLQPERRGNNFIPVLVKELPLVPRGLTGGNLVVNGNKLIVATGTRLAVFADQPPAASPPPAEIR